MFDRLYEIDRSLAISAAYFAIRVLKHLDRLRGQSVSGIDGMKRFIYLGDATVEEIALVERLLEEICEREGMEINEISAE